MILHSNKYQTYKRRVTSRLSVFIALLILPLYELSSTEYRVSSAAQITSAMAVAKAGDTLTMTNGQWINSAITFQGKGTAQLPIRLRAETYGQVVLTGTSTLRVYGQHLIVDGLLFKNGYSASGDVIQLGSSSQQCDSCRLTNTAVIDYNPSLNATDYKWISLYGSYNRVDHCYTKGKKHSGATLVVWLSNKPNYHRIDSNYFAFRPVLIYDGSEQNGGETIRVGTSDWSLYDSFTTVECNYFEECNGEIETISNKSCGNIYRSNTFVSCQGTLTLRHGNRCIVEGNFFFGNKVTNSGGIRIIGEDHKVYNNYITGTVGSSLKSALTIMNGVPNSPLNRYFQVKRAIVVFNTLVDNRYPINLGGGKTSEVSLPPLDCIMANNVVSSTTSPLITLTDTPINTTWEGNIFFGASLGISQPSGITIADPKLVKGSDGIWRPQLSSPLTNTAKGFYPFVISDMDGQARVDSFDIGADERSIAPITRRPLTAQDVGPPQQVWTSVERSLERQLEQRESWIESAYPNPFNSMTRISVWLPATERAVIQVYNLLGEKVQTLFDNSVMVAGSREFLFTADALPSGVYFVRLTSGLKVETHKLLYQK